MLSSNSSNASVKLNSRMVVVGAVMSYPSDYRIWFWVSARGIKSYISCTKGEISGDTKKSVSGHCKIFFGNFENILSQTYCDFDVGWREKI